MIMNHTIPTKITEVMDITVEKMIFAAEKDAVTNTDEFGEVYMAFRGPLI